MTSLKKHKKANRLERVVRLTFKRRKLQKRLQKNLALRHRADQRFQWMGLAAIVFAFVMMGALLSGVVARGYTILWRAEIHVPIMLDQALVDPEQKQTQESLRQGDYHRLIILGLKDSFPEIKDRSELLQLYGLLSQEASHQVRLFVLTHPELIGTRVPFWLPASSVVDGFLKGKLRDASSLKESQRQWLDDLKERDAVRLRFNLPFFTQGDSRYPEEAGFLGAMMGSLWVILSCLLVALPLGVMTAVYLEEFAPQNRWTALVEVNINNLAAVPSIIFGLLGLTVYVQFAGLPRSSAIAGGLTLALLVLPTLVIATRTSLAMVPRSIREAALAMGATKMQTVLHHVLPLSIPGIMTGTILSIARALGETAPLLMIGMVAFVVDLPHDVFAPTTAMPVQIYLWAGSSENGFSERTAAAILVLLLMLACMNFLAAFIRRRFEKKW